MSSLKLAVLPHQKAFILSEALHTCLLGGYGSGKSEAGVLKTLIKKMQYPEFSVAYYLPTYPLIRDIAFKKFAKVLNDNNIKFELNSSSKEIVTKYGTIILRSMDNPESIIGYEVAYSLIDEADVVPIRKMEDAFKNIIARNRCKLPDNGVNQTDIVSTPEGFGFLYNMFVKKASKNRVLIKARTADNPFLPEGYIKTLTETYTEEQLAAYLNGEFTNLNSGTVYKQFDRKLNHSDEREAIGDVLHIGMDFNIMKMHAVIHIIRNGLPIAVGEIVDAYDTSEMVRQIKEKYEGYRCVIYPDASGANRSTSGASDLQILKQSGYTINIRTKNPFVRDRVNAMNLNFCDNMQVRKYFVNTDQCPTYVESLEQLAYKNGEPDKSSGFDHITEAAGYFIYDRFGIRPVKRGLSV